MRIITMNGLRSYQFDDLEICVDGATIYAISNMRNIILGKYESLDRCLEIFHQIHNAYTNDAKLFLMPDK